MDDSALMDFLDQYASEYQDVDTLYKIAKEEGLTTSRRQFEVGLSSLLRSYPDRFYTELPFKRHYTKILSPSGYQVGLLKVSREWRKHQE